MFRRSALARCLVESLLLTTVIVAPLSIMFAEVRSSASYQLQSDSVNFGGGLSESDSYRQESTFGEVATGVSDSPSFSLRAGYQQMQAVFVSVAVASSALTLSPALGGLTGGEATGSTTITVLTDSPSGYELTIQASADPALRNGGETIADYLPIANPSPDYSFVRASTDVHFGFAVSGADVVDRFRNSGGLCNAGDTSTPLTCWDGLSVSPQPIARGLANQPGGVVTNIYFKVGIGESAAAVLPGTYTATSTVTAHPL